MLLLLLFFYYIYKEKNNNNNYINDKENLEIQFLKIYFLLLIIYL